MTVLLDDRVSAATEQEQFLFDLLGLPGIRCLRSADSTQKVEGHTYRVRADKSVNGWLGIDVHEGPSLKSSHALWANGWEIDEHEAAMQRAVPVVAKGLDVALSDISRSLKADVVITRNRGEVDLGTQHPSADPAQALALIGLHMRATGGHVVDAFRGGTMSVSLDWTRWLEAARLTERAWRAKLSLDSASNAGTYLQASIERVRQLLGARDTAMLSQLTVSDSPRYDPVAALELGALTAMAALDSAARAVNAGLGLGYDPRKISWHRRNEFCISLKGRAPETRALMDSAGVRAFISLLGSLRNTIHAEPLGPTTFRIGSGREETKARVPDDVSRNVCQRLEELGIADRWLVSGSDGILDPVMALHDLASWTPRLVSAVCDSVPWPSARMPPPLMNTDPEDLRWERNFLRNGWLYGIDLWASPVPYVWGLR